MLLITENALFKHSVILLALLINFYLQSVSLIREILVCTGTKEGIGLNTLSVGIRVSASHAGSSQQLTRWRHEM